MLAAAVAALTAIAVPSMASASNWSPVNTVHTLTSPSSITFDFGGGGTGAGFTCSSGPTFNSQVRTPASALMDLTSTTTNIPCTGTGALAGGSFTINMIGLPLWSVDGTSGASNVKINSVNIAGTAAWLNGPFTVSGTLTGGVWSNLTRSLTFANDTGLTITVQTGGVPAVWPVTVTASEFIKDTTSPFVSLL